MPEPISDATQSVTTPKVRPQQADTPEVQADTPEQNNPQQVMDSVFNLTEEQRNDIKAGQGDGVTVNGVTYSYDGNVMIASGTDVNGDGKNDVLVSDRFSSQGRAAHEHLAITDEEGTVFTDTNNSSFDVDGVEVVAIGRDLDIDAKNSSHVTMMVTGVGAGETSENILTVDETSAGAQFDHLRSTLHGVSYILDEDGNLAGMSNVGEEVGENGETRTQGNVTLYASVHGEVEEDEAVDRAHGRVFQGAFSETTLNEGFVTGTNAFLRQTGKNNSASVNYGGQVNQSGNSVQDAFYNYASGENGANIGQQTIDGTNKVNVTNDTIAIQEVADGGSGLNTAKTDDPENVTQTGPNNLLNPSQLESLIADFISASDMQAIQGQIGAISDDTLSDDQAKVIVDLLNAHGVELSKDDVQTSWAFIHADRSATNGEWTTQDFNAASQWLKARGSNFEPDSIKALYDDNKAKGGSDSDLLLTLLTCKAQEQAAA